MSSDSQKDWKWGLGIEHEVSLVHDTSYLYIRGEDLADHYKNILRPAFNKENEKYFKSLSIKKGDAFPVFVMFNLGPSFRELKDNKKLRKLHKSQQVMLDFNEFSTGCKSWETDFDNPGSYCMLEFVTRQFKNVTIKQAVNELEKVESDVLEMIRGTKYCNKTEALLGTIQYPLRSMSRFVTYEFNGRLEYVARNYFGSYHMNLTLPHHKDTSAETFDEEHLQFARLLQWITPLFIALYGGGDSASFMDDGDYSEGSYRALTNEHARPGAAPLRKTIPSNRWLSGKRSEWLAEIHSELDGYTKLSEDCDSPYSKKPGRCGTDFRRDKEKHQPPDRRFGFEFRIFDNIPSHYLPDLIMTILYLADHTYRHFLNKGKQVPQATKNNVWVNFMKNAAKNGWNTALSEEYDRLLRNILKINVKPTSYQTRLYYVDILGWLEKKYYKRGHFTDIIYAGKKKPKLSLVGKKDPDLPNMWTQRTQIYLFFRNPRMYRKLSAMMKSIRKHKVVTDRKFQKLAIKHFGSKVLSDLEDLIDFLVSQKYITLLNVEGNDPQKHKMKFLKMPKMINYVPQYEDREYIPMKYPSIPIEKRSILESDLGLGRIGRALDNVLNIEFDQIFESESE